MEYINKKKENRSIEYLNYITNEFPDILEKKYVWNGEFSCVKIHENNDVYLVFDKEVRHHLHKFSYEIFSSLSEEKSLNDIVKYIESKYSGYFDRNKILKNVCIHIS